MKWTKECIVNYINANTEYVFIDFIEFNGIYSMVVVSCKNHGEFNIKFRNLKNNINRKCCSCKECTKEIRRERFKLSFEEVKSFIEKEGYTLLSNEYINSNTKICLKCPICNNEFYMTFGNFKYKNQRCPKCANEHRNDKNRHSYEYIKNYIENDGNYELLSNVYKNAHGKLLIRCKKHDYIYMTTYHDFQRGNRCVKCSNESRAFKLRHDYEYIKNYIEKEGEILLSKDYKNNLELLDIECKNRHRYKMSFGNFMSNHRCPICNESKGEKRISDILNNFDIKYIRQYKFNDCKFKHCLPFDFYLSDYNCCIEFDGEQHYEIVEHFGGFDSFVNTKIRDTIKNEYCKNNNIKLIRIPYWEFDNIENILKRELEL